MEIRLRIQKSVVFGGQNITLLAVSDDTALLDMEPNYREPVLSHDEMDDGQICCGAMGTGTENTQPKEIIVSEQREFEMSEQDLSDLLNACRPVPYMVFGTHEPRSPQENANDAWAALGRKLGFDHMTVRPIAGKSDRFFMAVPTVKATP